MPSSVENPPVAPLARRLTDLSLRRPRTIVAVAFVVAAVGFGLATRLSLQTDLAELLPPRAPSVIALKQLNRRVGGTGNVAIALEGEPTALRAFIPFIVETLRKELGPDLLAIKYQRKDVADFFDRFAAWYVDEAELTKWQSELAEAIARTANPALVDLDDEPAPKPAAAPPTGASAPAAVPSPPAPTNEHASQASRLAGEVRAARGRVQPHADFDPATGYLMSEGGHLAVLFVRPAANSLNLAGSDGMLRRIQGIVDGTHPAERGVRVSGFTGSIPAALAEVKRIEDDIVSTALLVCLLVGGVVVLYFRGLRELFFLVAAVIVGLAVALGFAAVAIGHVNAQTAFLGSIILGTGINYGIILLDRYRQMGGGSLDERLAGPVDLERLRGRLERALDDTLRATWVAALATGVSFGVLAAGEVESFRQFGWIGGVGILACWAATFALLPAILVLVDGRAPSRLVRALAGLAPVRLLRRGLAASERVEPLRGALRLVGLGAARAPWLVAFVAAGAGAWSLHVTWKARGRYIETDLRNLGSRSRATAPNGMEKLDNRLRKMDDRSSTPAVIATDSIDDTLGVCQVLTARAETDLKGVLTRCYSINDLLPRDIERRRALMDHFARDLAKLPMGELDAGDRAEYEMLLKHLAERPPTVEDLPLTLREYYTERDGSVGKLAFVDPKDDHLEQNLYRFADAIREVRLPSGKVILSSGESVVFADVLRAMRRDVRRLTVLSAVLVLLVLALVTRRLGPTVRVGAALCLGVVVMCGVAIATGEKLNFFNFVALPTTFGIGIDYAINVEERLRRRAAEEATAIGGAIGEVGPAVLLASLTSIFGYLSLVTADSRVLSSFGELAIFGEAACVLFSLLLVPALWRLSVGKRRRAATDPASATKSAASG